MHIPPKQPPSPRSNVQPVPTISAVANVTPTADADSAAEHDSPITQAHLAFAAIDAENRVRISTIAQEVEASLSGPDSQVDRHLWNAVDALKGLAASTHPQHNECRDAANSILQACRKRLHPGMATAIEVFVRTCGQSIPDDSQDLMGILNDILESCTEPDQTGPYLQTVFALASELFARRPALFDQLHGPIARILAMRAEVGRSASLLVGNFDIFSERIDRIADDNVKVGLMKLWASSEMTRLKRIENDARPNFFPDYGAVCDIAEKCTALGSNELAEELLGFTSRKLQSVKAEVDDGSPLSGSTRRLLEAMATRDPRQSVLAQIAEICLAVPLTNDTRSRGLYEKVARESAKRGSDEFACKMAQRLCDAQAVAHYISDDAYLLTCLHAVLRHVSNEQIRADLGAKLLEGSQASLKSESVQANLDTSLKLIEGLLEFDDESRQATAEILAGLLENNPPEQLQLDHAAMLSYYADPSAHHDHLYSAELQERRLTLRNSEWARDYTRAVTIHIAAWTPFPMEVAQVSAVYVGTPADWPTMMQILAAAPAPPQSSKPPREV